MKKTLLSLVCVFFAVLSGTMVYGQIEVQSDGAIKLGELDKATNVTGSSLDIAVKQIYVYTTANPSASFSIYNNTQGLVAGGAKASSSGWNFFNQRTYMVPKTSGGLVLGTSTNKLGEIYTEYLSVAGQSVTSDARVKTNVRTIGTAEMLRNLRPVKFDFDGEKVALREEMLTDHAGFIAQEMVAVLPELVHYDSLSDLYSVDYVSLIPYLTRGYQEQDSIIRRQQAMLEVQGELIAGLAEQLNSLQELLVSDKSSPAPKKNSVTGVKEQANVLYQNAPNPFNQETRIRYELSKDARTAQIVLYDMNGLQLKAYNLPLQPKGEWVLQAGSLPAGIYLYSLVVDGVQVDLKRMVLMD